MGCCIVFVTIWEGVNPAWLALRVFWSRLSSNRACSRDIKVRSCVTGELYKVSCGLDAGSRSCSR